MKVKIGPYVNRWTTCRLERRLKERLYGEEFYSGKYQETTVTKVIDYWSNVFQGVLNYTVNLIQDRRNRVIKVRIDSYDTWSMDHTLSLIILPMLKQLKETKHGSPIVDLEDLPPELQLNYTPSNETSQFDMFASSEVDEIAWSMHEKRWDYILDSMIFSFEMICRDDWEQEFYSGEIDIKWEHSEDYPGRIAVEGPRHTFKVDQDGINKVNERIEFGLRMFGKYYRGLWD